MRSSYLGLDIGTSAVKTIIVNDDGEYLASTQCTLTVSVPRPGWSEQAPEHWWDATVSAVRAAVEAMPDGYKVEAIGLSGQMHSLVILDEADQVIRPAILWNDVRTTAQCEEIESMLGLDRLGQLVGNRALEGFTAPKLLWLAENESDSYAHMRTVLMPKDYVRLRMTGERATDPSDAAGTLLFDIRTGRWSLEMLEALRLSSERLPRIAGSAEVSGYLIQSVARDLGLAPGTPVVGGGADNAAAAIGAGVITGGTGSVSIGSSGVVVVPIDVPQVDPEMRLHTFNHAIPDMWYVMGVVLSAGAALSWWRGIIDCGGGTSEYAEIISQASTISPGCDGLTFLPYLTGERTPHADSNARGVFFGLHAGHQRAHMVRAVMEGVTLALLDSLSLMIDLGNAPGELVIVGGGARSSTWKQMISDAFDLPVVSLSKEGGAPLGAAILGACGAGRFRDPSIGAVEWVTRGETILPRADHRQAYRQAYERYRGLYPALRDKFAQ